MKLFLTSLTLLAGLGIGSGPVLYGSDGGSTDHSSRQEGLIIVRAGTVYVGDGRVLEDIRIHIRKGKIAKIEKDEGEIQEKDAKIIDLRRKTLMPGIIAAHTELVAADVQWNLTPDIVAADNYDWFNKNKKLLASGLTTVYLSPGRKRLVAGQGSVVKLAGSELGARLLEASASLRIDLSELSRRSVPAIFEPNPTPTSESPLLPPRAQKGSSLPSQLDVLRKAFAEAKAHAQSPNGNGNLGGIGPVAARYELTAFNEVAAGRLPVRLAVRNAYEIRQGLSYFASMGARVVLEMPQQAVLLKDRLAQALIPTVIAMPLRPSLVFVGDHKKEKNPLPVTTPELAGQLSKAGVAVAIVGQSDQDLDKLRMLAGLAARFGMDEDKALMAITLEAAKTIGVEDRLGSLETGKDADFVVLSGRPFDARSQVEAVYIEGVLVYEIEEHTPPFVVKAGRVLLGDGRELRNAIVVVKNGKITDVGPYAEIPPGAIVHEHPDSVLLPGFIAAATRLGLHTDSGGTKITAGPEVDVAAALDATDEAFAKALEAGITSLFVTPDGSGSVFGRVAAVKTDGSGKDFVTRAICGLQMSLSSGGDAGKKKLLAELKKAKLYIHPPKPKVTKKAKAPKKPVKKPVAKEQAKPKPSPFAGAWSGTMLVPPMPGPLTFHVDIKVKGAEVTAEVRIDSALPIPGFPLTTTMKGKIESDEMTIKGDISFQGETREITYTAKIEDGKLVGELTGMPGDAIKVTATRDVDPSADEKTAKTPPKKAKPKVKKNERLEPFRPVLTREAALIITCTTRDAVLAAIDAIVTTEKLRCVITGAAKELAKKPIQLPQGKSIGYLLSVNEVSFTEKGKKTMVAQALADMGFDVILVGRVQKGTAYLPVHAAYAVSQGFDSRKALSSLTAAPARCFGLENRVGLLAVGRDADLVLMSGDPFDLPSRIQKVWVNGRLGVDKLAAQDSSFKPGTSGKSGPGPKDNR